MLAFAHASREPLAIHYWAVFQFNTVLLTINARLERFAELAFALQFVHRIVNVLQISYVSKEFVNPHAMIIQPALISNSVRIMCALRKFVVALMAIA